MRAPIGMFSTASSRGCAIIMAAVAAASSRASANINALVRLLCGSQDVPQLLNKQQPKCYVADGNHTLRQLECIKALLRRS